MLAIPMELALGRWLSLCGEKICTDKRYEDRGWTVVQALGQGGESLAQRTFVGLGLRGAEDVVGADVLHELDPRV